MVEPVRVDSLEASLGGAALHELVDPGVGERPLRADHTADTCAWACLARIRRYLSRARAASKLYFTVRVRFALPVTVVFPRG